MYGATLHRNTLSMKDYWIIIVSALMATAGSIVTWLLNRKKQSADITESITSAAQSITSTNKILLDTLNMRVQELERDIKDLTEQNKNLADQNKLLAIQTQYLTERLSAIGNLILRTEGDSIPKTEIAELIK